MKTRIDIHVPELERPEHEYEAAALAFCHVERVEVAFHTELDVTIESLQVIVNGQPAQVDLPDAAMDRILAKAKADYRLHAGGVAV